MKRTLLLASLLYGNTALADAPRAPTAQQLQQMQRHQQTARVLMLAEALDLDAAGALRLQSQLAPFETQKAPLMEQMKALHEELERAASGEAATTSARVDAITQQLQQLHNQLEDVDRQSLVTASAGMTPQQKAKLALHLFHGPHGGPGMPPPGEPMRELPPLAP